MCSDGIRLKVDRKQHNSGYIFTFINSPHFRSQAIAASTGSTRQRIGLSDLRKLKVIVPGKEEQDSIFQVLTNMESEIGFWENRLDKTKAIKQGMMQELLTGRTRLVKTPEPFVQEERMHGT